jgi:DNA primase
MSSTTQTPRYDAAAIKRSRPISDVAQGLGLEVSASGTETSIALCPFHDDRHPSLLLDDRDNHFHCFACKAHGDAIDLVMVVNGICFAEACERLAAGSAVGPPERAEGSHASPPLVGQHHGRAEDLRPRARRWERLDLEEQLVMNAAHALYTHLLWRNRGALEYLRGRGIPDRVTRECGLGYSDGRTLVGYLGKRRGLEVARELGLLGHPRREGHPRADIHTHLREFFGGRIVVPELRGGQPIWMIGRALSGSPNAPRYLALPGERPVLGWERAAGREEAFLCEGVIDYLTAVSWRLPAFSTCGTSLPDERFGFLARASAVYGLLDGDDAGRKAAERFGERLGERWKAVELPEGHDLNDLGRLPDGQARFAALLEAARGDARKGAMMARSTQDLRTADGPTGVDILRDRVLRAGARLGWRPNSVAAFAEALTGTPWSGCGDRELREVLDEYDALVLAVERKRARKRSPEMPERSPPWAS